MGARRTDITGKRFGMLVAIEFTKSSKSGQAMWLCKCDCGGEKIILAHSLLRGYTNSCGCLSKKHGMYFHELYQTWYGIKRRCLNEDNNAYHRYGGRGIKICDEWLSVNNFIEWAERSGWSTGLQIDRIDNNGNYEPSNCQWITNTENCEIGKRNKYETNTSGYTGVTFEKGPEMEGEINE